MNQLIDQQEESLSLSEMIYTIERSLKDCLRKPLGWPSRLFLTASIIETELLKKHVISLILKKPDFKNQAF